MTHDPPETQAGGVDSRAPVDWGRLTDVGPTSHHVTISPPSPPPTPRDPSNLNDPKLQRAVIALAWGLVLVLLGTCVAGGVCLVSKCGEAPLVECPAGVGVP